MERATLSSTPPRADPTLSLLALSTGLPWDLAAFRLMEMRGGSGRRSARLYRTRREDCPWGMWTMK